MGHLVLSPEPSPKRPALGSRRRVAPAALGLLVLWWALASMRTEFSLLQQTHCQLALWHDARVRVVEPLRLHVPNATERLRGHQGSEACVPRTIDAATVAYPSHHAFYDKLRRAQRTSLPPPPVFAGPHAVLCNEFRGAYSGWDYCLPITGRKDDAHCTRADRDDLLTKIDTPCFGSALHMLLVDVYSELQRVGGRPAMLFGTLLGAVRNGSTIPFTEDADVGYVCHAALSLATLREALRTLGYHMFYQGVWRVCISPIHPLAPVLFDANMTTTKKHKVPYVDLYAMSPEGRDRWFVEKMEHDRRIPRDKFEPYTHVTINGMVFDTVADPIDFLVHEYGDNYMQPKPRRRLQT